jgi:hypothetical protein
MLYESNRLKRPTVVFILKNSKVKAGEVTNKIIHRLAHLDLMTRPTLSRM